MVIMLLFCAGLIPLCLQEIRACDSDDIQSLFFWTEETNSENYLVVFFFYEDRGVMRVI